jgi:hypothetical protein
MVGGQLSMIYYLDCDVTWRVNAPKESQLIPCFLLSEATSYLQITGYPNIGFFMS